MDGTLQSHLQGQLLSIGPLTLNCTLRYNSASNRVVLTLNFVVPPARLILLLYWWICCDDLRGNLFLCGVERSLAPYTQGCWSWAKSSRVILLFFEWRDSH